MATSAVTFAVVSRTVVMPWWWGWALLAGAVGVLVGMTALLVIVARRSNWPPRR